MFITRQQLARTLAVSTALAIAGCAIALGQYAWAHGAQADPLITTCELVGTCALGRLAWVCALSVRDVSTLVAQPSVHPAEIRPAARASWSLRLAGLFLTAATALLGSNSALATSTTVGASTVAAAAAIPGLGAPLPTFVQAPDHPSFAPLNSTLASGTLEAELRDCEDLGPGWTMGATTGCDVLLGRPQPVVTESYTVMRGDSLWTIAAAQLDPDASARDIALELQAWTRANPQLVDPSDLRVGDVLVRPQSAR